MHEPVPVVIVSRQAVQGVGKFVVALPLAIIATALVVTALIKVEVKADTADSVVLFLIPHGSRSSVYSQE